MKAFYTISYCNISLSHDNDDNGDGDGDFDSAPLQ